MSSASIAEMFQRARKRVGWTQEQLASALGASQRSVQGWESGKNVPAADTFLTAMRVLGTPTVFCGIGQQDTQEVPYEATRNQREIAGLVHCPFVQTEQAVGVCTSCAFFRGVHVTRSRVSVACALDGAVDEAGALQVERGLR